MRRKSMKLLQHLALHDVSYAMQPHCDVPITQGRNIVELNTCMMDQLMLASHQLGHLSCDVANGSHILHVLEMMNAKPL